MPQKEIAVQGATLKFTNPSISGVKSITKTPSTKVKVDGKGAHRGATNYSVSGAQLATCAGALGVGSISPTAQKSKDNDNPFLRKGDQDTITVNGIDTSTLLACSFSVTVEVDNPNQDKVKAE